MRGVTGLRYSPPVPTSEPDSLLSPCVLVVKTPVAARQGMAGRLARSREGLAGEAEGAAREQEVPLAGVGEPLAGLDVAPITVSMDPLYPQARRALGRARF